MSSMMAHRGTKKRNRGGGSGPAWCLTMHQPWASLLVEGIKRAEGRDWPWPRALFAGGVEIASSSGKSARRGVSGAGSGEIPARVELWIHAAAEKPDAEKIRSVEVQYQRVYALENKEGELRFPQNYPCSCLIGCVTVEACVPQTLFQRLDLPTSIHSESSSPFVFLCSRPRHLIMPLPMSGQHKVWKLTSQQRSNAVDQGLVPVGQLSPPPFKEALAAYCSANEGGGRPSANGVGSGCTRPGSGDASASTARDAGQNAGGGKGAERGAASAPGTRLQGVFAVLQEPFRARRC